MNEVRQLREWLLAVFATITKILETTAHHNSNVHADRMTQTEDNRPVREDADLHGLDNSTTSSGDVRDAFPEPYENYIELDRTTAVSDDDSVQRTQGGLRGDRR